MSATATITANGKSSLSLVAAVRVLGRLSLEQAEAKAEQLSVEHPEWSDVLIEALEKHPGNKPASQVSSVTPAAVVQTAPKAGLSSKEGVLKALAAGEIDVTTAATLLAAFEPHAKAATITCKVSAKGAVSVYGLQRMPVTLYAEQWERLPKIISDTVLPFIKANEGKECLAAEYVDGKATGRMVKTQITRK